MELGERIFQLVLKADPGNAAGYVMLSNIYAAAGKWDLSEDVQYQRFNMECEKQPCHIWIDMSKAVHMFVVNYHDHPQGLKFRQG